MTEQLRIVEIAEGIGGSACGRLFAALGHEVVKCEPRGGSALRHQPPFNAAGDGLASVTLDADKRSVLTPWDDSAGREALQMLLDRADVAIVDLPPAQVVELGLAPESLRASRPNLVAAYVSTCGVTGPDATTGPEARLPSDSLLAEAYGGLATMVGDPRRRPLALGGEQAAYSAGVTAFLGIMLALLRRDRGDGGDVVDVAMTDVVAYMDWKSDVGLAVDHQAPTRSLSDGGSRLIRASDAWVGAIFQHRHWPAVVSLVGDPALADPSLEQESTWARRADEWWPVIERWVSQHTAKDVYERAQKLGLPFGWALTVADLMDDDQIRSRGFIRQYSPQDEGFVPPVGAPLRCERLQWRCGRSPAVGSSRLADLASVDLSRADALPSAGIEWAGDGPLSGVTVLDFGTITAGASVTRLLADYGATVLKIESLDRPDLFRWWKGSTAYFPSNNIGKRGVGINLKTNEGRELLHQLARRSHVLVENFRVGVTTKLGIDAATLLAINPELIYLSLSSQGQHGPQSRNISYGSTLDLLSGLASLTGYAPDQPIWSSSNVNYPDQLVSLFGAAFVTYCLRSGITGVHLDVSQREVVSWTLAAQIADFRANGVIARASGNRRPGRAPHDIYPCREVDRWFAISCSADEQREALARCLDATELASRPASWWSEHQDLVDSLIIAWARQRSRDECVAALRDAGVPTVPVLNAADRAATPRFVRRLVKLPGDEAVKGFPMRFLGYQPSLPTTTPALGEHTRHVLTELTGISAARLDELQQAGVIHQAT